MAETKRLLKKTTNGFISNKKNPKLQFIVGIWDF